MRCQAAMLGRGTMPDLVFTPHLLPVRRGILATIHVSLAEPLNSPQALWLDDYAGEPFVQVLPEGVPSLADAVGTNQVVIGVAPVQGTVTPMVTVIAAIDNLLKGAAGQAVQNLNLMFGWPETEGLA
jgi:N-acetyl-gamma-glutamyl-phosphate reductase